MTRTLPPAVRRAGSLLSSSVLAQIAVLAATAIAASRLVPHDFALFGAMTGLSAVLATVSTLQSEARLPALEEGPARALVRTGVTANALLGVLSLAVAGALALAGSDWSLVVAIGGLCTVVLGIQRLLFALALRARRSDLLARYRVVQGLANAVLILLGVAVLPLPGAVGLGLAWAVSLVIGTAAMLIGWRPPVSVWRGTLARADWREQWQEVGMQPLAALMAGGVGPLPLLALPVLGQPLVGGAWSLCNRFLVPVVNTTYSTLQPLYVERASEEMRRGRPDLLRRVHNRWAVALALPSALAALGCYVVIVWALPLLGPQWVIGREVVWPAIIYFVTLFWCLPLSQTLLLAGRKDLQMAWTVVRFALAVLGFATVLVVDARTALLLWSLASAVTFLGQLWLNSWALRSGTRRSGAPPTGPDESEEGTRP